MTALLWNHQISNEDLDQVGQMASKLAELHQQKVPIPKFFVIPTETFSNFLTQNKLKNQFITILNAINNQKTEQAKDSLSKIQQQIIQYPLDTKTEHTIIKAYLKFQHQWLANPNINLNPQIISSKQTQPLQLPLITNIIGESNLLLNIKQAWASAFSIEQYQKHPEIFQNIPQLAILIQEQISADISGRLTTINPLTQQKNTLVIEAFYGTENIFNMTDQTPDHYTVNKYSHSIVSKKIHRQNYKFTIHHDRLTKINLKAPLNQTQKLTDQQILELTKIAKKTESFMLEPQELTWAIKQGQFYIKNISPLNIQKTITPNQKILQTTESTQALQQLFSGIPASPGITTGQTIIKLEAKGLNKLKKHHILVISQPTKTYAPALRKVSGIISSKGSQISELAILARETGIPCIVGATDAIKKLSSNQIITINGNTGQIFAGSQKTKHSSISESTSASEKQTPKDIDTQLVEFLSLDPIKTATKIDCTVNNIKTPETYANLPFDAVGLVDGHSIYQQNPHPRHLNTSTQLNSELNNYLTKLCQTFAPRPVIFQLSNHSTNFFKQLSHSSDYEETENNPLIGIRGASKHLLNTKILKLETKAIKTVRHQSRQLNLQIALPIIRSSLELTEIKKFLASYNLSRTPSLKYWFTISTPANILEMNQYARIGIDGFIIDYDLLLQLVLGIDIQTDVFNKIFKSNLIPIESYLSQILKTANKLNLPTNIYGHQLNNNLNIIEKLVEFGITRVSVSPQTLQEAREITSFAEKRLTLT